MIGARPYSVKELEQKRLCLLSASNFKRRLGGNVIRFLLSGLAVVLRRFFRNSETNLLCLCISYVFFSAFSVLWWVSMEGGTARGRICSKLSRRCKSARKWTKSAKLRVSILEPWSGNAVKASQAEWKKRHNLPHAVSVKEALSQYARWQNNVRTVRCFLLGFGS